MTLALEGIKIIDLSRYAPGQACTMTLGDLGAEVICVETPPEVNSRVTEKSKQPRASVLRNKKSVALNLEAESGKEFFYKLARNADVIVEGFRPGVVQRLGVDYETIKKINPRIIYCSITGYGQNGPYRNLPGHDPNYLAITGVLDMTGERGRPPVIPPLNLIGNMAGGANSAVSGILVALLARERTGKGQFVDIAIVDGILSLYSSMAYMYLETGKVLKRGESWLTGGSAWSNVFKTKDDKYISISCPEPWTWERLCRALGHEDLIACQFDKKRSEEILESLQKTFLNNTRDRWFELLRKADVNVAPVHSIDEVFRDPHVIHREMVVEVDDSTRGKSKQIGIGIKLSDTPGKIRNPGPVLGQHTKEVLTGLGYTKTVISKMEETGAIYLAKQELK